ncbi:FkbM family methyltransferase [Wenzhouxiangella limi]|uniref:FkbM family methyltransferase n=1 Tax=Wenzhouxiangella limi TaxID=2707351 RepID=A0A845VGH4_9GAMM|nr:FkbM family methyltransferase [Wenzhouxiangella limi]NDY96309.1 FkbM family methyltransferase [Wenzhouxiangella limi]
MNWLEGETAELAGPDLIIHLGAGIGQDLETWQQRGALRIVLLEPHPEFLPELLRQSENMEGVEVIGAALSDHSGRDKLRLCSYPLLSSLRDAPELAKVWPGAQVVGEEVVETLSLADLLALVQPSEQQENWLMIDVPGEEAKVLDQLAASSHKHLFSRIFLAAGLEALHKGAEPASKLLQSLEALGYRRVGVPDDADQDWPRYHLALNQLAVKNETLQEQLKALEGQLSERSAELERSEQARGELEEKLGREKASLQEQIKSLEAQLSERESELQESVHQQDIMQARIAEQRTRVMSLEAQLQDRNELAEMRRLLDVQRDSLGQMRQAILQGIQSSVSDITAYAALQSRLGSGHLLLEPVFQSQLPPNLSLILLEHLEESDPELVLIFDCGAAALLFADAIKERWSDFSELSPHNEAQQSTEENASSDAREMALRQDRQPDKPDQTRLLPAPVVAFEHVSVSCDRLSRQVKALDLQHLVEVEYSPLVEQASSSGNHPLFPACQRKLESIAAATQGKTLRLMAFIDASSGDFEPGPALTLMLNTFPGCSLTIVVHGDDESLDQHWTATAQERHLPLDYCALPGIPATSLFTLDAGV